VNEAARVLPFERAEGRLLTRVQRNEGRAFALSILRDSEYRKNLLAAARARSLPPAVEVALMAHGWGRPVAQVEVGEPGAFSSLSELGPSALAERAEALAAVLRAQVPPSETELREVSEQTDEALLQDSRLEGA
jgi:hypothetical protein